MFKVSNARSSMKLLIYFMFVPTLLLGCGPISRTVQTLKDFMADLPKESSAWRTEFDKISDELPTKTREEVEVAIVRATTAVGEEFRCNTDFIRDRLQQDIERVIAGLTNQPVSVRQPVICGIYPRETIELDESWVPKGERWLKFSGYDLDAVKMEVLLEHVRMPPATSITTMTLTACCLDHPTHYAITINLDSIQFGPGHRRIILKWPEGERTVTIVRPTIPSSSYEIRVKTGCVNYAGTNARVSIELFGAIRSSGVLNLDNSGDDREKCDLDVYQFGPMSDLGDLKSVAISHDNSGDDSGWFLDWVTVTNKRTHQTWNFPCGKWLATDVGDEKTARTISVNGSCN